MTLDGPSANAVVKNFRKGWKPTQDRQIRREWLDVFLGMKGFWEMLKGSSKCWRVPDLIHW